MKPESIIQILKDLKYKSPCKGCPFRCDDSKFCCVIDYLVPWIENMEALPEDDEAEPQEEKLDLNAKVKVASRIEWNATHPLFVDPDLADSAMLDLKEGRVKAFKTTEELFADLDEVPE